jgi:hypothetical protein
MMCIGKNGRVEEDERQEPVDLAQRVVHHPAEHLREPEEDAAEDRESEPPNTT